MTTKLAGWAASTADPEQVSSRIKGGILVLSSFLIYMAAAVFNVTLTPEDVVQFATMLSGVAGLVVSLYGAIHALVRWIAAKRA